MLYIINIKLYPIDVKILNSTVFAQSFPPRVILHGADSGAFSGRFRYMLLYVQMHPDT